MSKIDGPKHTKFVCLKWYLWCTMSVCSTTQSTMECMMTQMMNTAFRYSLPVGVGVLCTDSTCSKMCLSWMISAYWLLSMWQCYHEVITSWCYSAKPKGIFKSAAFGERVWPVSGYFVHFLHNFHAQGVTLKSKVLATKYIFQNYSQLLDIFTMLILKTAKKLIVPSVYT